MEIKLDDRAYWDRAAQAYDAHMNKSRRMYQTLIALIRSELKPEFLVLDLGTGTGEIPLSICNSVRAIEAVDYSGEMIKYAMAKATERCIENVTFRTQSLANPFPYDAEQFDVVLAANILHIVPNPDIILGEAHRVLKHTGKLLAPTYVHDETLASRLISRVLQWRGHPIYTRYHSAGLARLLERNGFVVVRQQPLKNIMPASFVVALKEMD